MKCAYKHCNNTLQHTVAGWTDGASHQSSQYNKPHVKQDVACFTCSSLCWLDLLELCVLESETVECVCLCMYLRE